MKNSPLFNHEEDFVTDLEFARGRVLEQVKFLLEEYKISYEQDLADPSHKGQITYSMCEYSSALANRLIFNLFLYIDSIQGLVSEIHRNYIDRAYSFNDYGCFAKTELGHGSNVNAIETVASLMNKLMFSLFKLLIINSLITGNIWEF